MLSPVTFSETSLRTFCSWAVVRLPSRACNSTRSSSRAIRRAARRSVDFVDFFNCRPSRAVKQAVQNRDFFRRTTLAIKVRIKVRIKTARTRKMRFCNYLIQNVLKNVHRDEGSIPFTRSNSSLPPPEQTPRRRFPFQFSAGRRAVRPGSKSDQWGHETGS